MTTSPVERIDGERFCYPDFQPGQVLSHRDLNLLRDYAYTKSMFQNRSFFGYGVACGLRGVVQSNARLAITAGFGLSADGRELRLEEPFAIDVAELADMRAGDFVTHPEVRTSDRVGGYTALLVRNDEVHAGECSDGCASEAETVCERARIVFARGRLSLAAVSDDPIFALAPVAPSSSFRIDGAAFEALRDALADYLRPLLGEATVELLADLELDGTPALDLMRLGILNEVLYATWGYARCVAQQSADCFRPGTENALALGWLNQAGSNWLWDPAYRHHFELAPALYAAIYGNRGRDLCAQYLDRIRSMLQSFTVPEVPEEDGGDGGGGGGGIIVDPGDIHICDTLHLKRRGCWWLPGEVYPIPDWPDHWPIDPTDPLGPWFDEGPLVNPGTIYPAPYVDEELNVLDLFGSGAVRLSDVVGAAGNPAAEALGTAIRDRRGIDTQVQVVPVEEMSGFAGFKPGVFVSTADTIVLGVNAAGTVVATGSVPAATTMRDAGTRLPGVEAAANEAAATAATAFDSASTALAQAGTANEWIGTFQAETLPELTSLRQQWDDFQAELPDFGLVNDALAQQNVLFDRIATLERDLGIQGERINTVDEVARGVETRFEAERRLTEERFAGVNTRVDSAMGSGLLEAGTGMRVQDLNRGMFELMRSMQEVMVEAAPATRRRAVESALGGTAETMATLEAASGDPRLLVTSRAEETARVMEGMMEGLRAMGAAEETVTDLQGRLDSFNRMLGR